jgi:tol-pal system protein YbgF
VIRRLATAVLVWGLAGPAGAASKDIEHLQVQISSLQGQIADLQRQSEDSSREIRRLNEALAEQNVLLKKNVQDQRIQDESLQAALKDLADRLADIQARVQGTAMTAPPPGATVAAGVDAATPGAGVPTQPPVAASVPLPAPKELYSQAYADYARGNYDLAVQGFQEYIKNYPNTDFSDNAQYWIGECLYGKQRYADAIEAWKTLLRDYPSTDKLPDARVKMGMALEKLGRRSQALLEYRYVVDRYPNSQAARVARDKLNPQ